MYLWKDVHLDDVPLEDAQLDDVQLDALFCECNIAITLHFVISMKFGTVESCCCYLGA